PDIFKDWPIPHAVINEPLDLMQHRFTFLAIRLHCLLFKQRINVRISAVCPGTVARDHLRQAGSRITVERGRAHAKALRLLGRNQSEEGAALCHAHFEPDAYRLEVSTYCLAEREVRRELV